MRVIASRPRQSRSQERHEALPPLEQGDNLDQPTFHARYEAMQTDRTFELIGGIVFLATNGSRSHGQCTVTLIGWLSEYEASTPGLEGLAHASAILGPEDEVQPDASLCLNTELGGQTREEDGWMVGPPELTIEVASSTDSYDLHAKKPAYEKHGVKEYLVLALRQSKVFWFIARHGKFEELPPGADGILRSETFPGLWLDPAALVNKDRQRLLEVLRQGLASPEHAAFVAKLNCV